ncbi:MAG: DMT family transporter [Microscillaceae bacterium]|jgi:drug/metabolite transporter (DMT)-like permease|nr:DMT family transporter [Microscillaceae bacterium]
MPNLKDYLQLHFIVLIWGFTAILGKLISIPALELVFYRTLLASVLLAGVLYGQKKSFRVGKRDFWVIIGTGMLIAMHWILFFGAAKLNASVCLAGMTTATLWTSMIEPIFHRRKIKLFEIALGLVVIGGLYLIFRFEFNHGLALLMAIASAFLAAVFSVINSQLVMRHDHYTITFYEMVGAWAGTVLFLPLHILYLSDNQGINFLPTSRDVFYIFILAGVCTVYAYSMGVKLMKKFTPFAVNLTVNLEPVYGIVLAFLIFGKEEQMTSGFYLGTLIILGAVLTYPYLKNYFSGIRKKKLQRAIETRREMRKQMIS